MNCAAPRRQQGAVLITVALLFLFVLGFMGIAIDLGRLFTVRSELQTAVDSCALAAAYELDQQDTSITRAQNAGTAAGNANRVNMQSATWAGQGQLTNESLTFLTSAGNTTTNPLQAVYAQCEHMQSNINMYLLQALGMVATDPTPYPNARAVFATAVATRVSAQTTCPIPIALKRAPGTTAPLYGFQIGQWVTVLGNRNPGSGEWGWYNLDGSTNARATRDQLEEGRCGTRVGDTLGTPGAKTAVDVVWNYRFGIYRNNVDVAEHRPDFSGYSYTSTNWKNAPPQNAWDGTPAAGSDPSAQNFLAKRANFRSFDDTGTDIRHGSTVVFGQANRLNSFNTVATPGTSGQHGQLGANRRVATVPVIDDGNHVIDYMCVFMLHPLTGPNDDAIVEVRGNAGAGLSPCTTSGLPGGAAGPLVPALVR